MIGLCQPWRLLVHRPKSFRIDECHSFVCDCLAILWYDDVNYYVFRAQLEGPLCKPGKKLMPSMDTSVNAFYGQSYLPFLSDVPTGQ